MSSDVPAIWGDSGSVNSLLLGFLFKVQVTVSRCKFKVSSRQRCSIRTSSIALGSSWSSALSSESSQAGAVACCSNWKWLRNSWTGGTTSRREAYKGTDYLTLFDFSVVCVR